MRMRVAVIGSGVIGLTTAVVLAERGARVSIWARDQAEHTTSAVAGALWEPYRAEPADLVNDWAARTFDTLADLSQDEGTGVRMVAGVKVGRTGEAEHPWWNSITPVTPVAADALPSEFRWGLRARLPLLDMPVYLDYLRRRFLAAGGQIVRRTLGRLTDVDPDEADVIVNASGLGARDLVPDDEVRPIQGQLVVTQNPGIDQWLVEATGGAAEGLYVFPQPDNRVILGGTAYDGRWGTAPDLLTAERIIARCSGVFPALKGARVLEHRVGLRPYRPRVRLERQVLDSGVVCVHSYGHGGAGITVSWACADDTASLVAGS